MSVQLKRGTAASMITRAYNEYLGQFPHPGKGGEGEITQVVCHLPAAADHRRSGDGNQGRNYHQWK